MKKIVLALSLSVLVVASAFSLSVGTVGSCVVANIDIGNTISTQLGGSWSNNSAGTDISLLGRVDSAIIQKGVLSGGVQGSLQMNNTAGGSSSTHIYGGLFAKVKLNEKATLFTDIPVISMISSSGSSSIGFGISGGQFGILFELF